MTGPTGTRARSGTEENACKTEKSLMNCTTAFPLSTIEVLPRSRQRCPQRWPRPSGCIADSKHTRTGPTRPPAPGTRGENTSTPSLLLCNSRKIAATVFELRPACSSCSDWAHAESQALARAAASPERCTTLRRDMHDCCSQQKIAWLATRRRAFWRAGEWRDGSRARQSGKRLRSTLAPWRLKLCLRAPLRSGGLSRVS